MKETWLYLSTSKTRWTRLWIYSDWKYSYSSVDHWSQFTVFLFIDVDMSPRDPRWLGAWWLGFVVFGVLTFIFALPMLCFPRYLADKKSKNYIDKEKLNAETTTDQSTKLSRFERFKGKHMYPGSTY